MGAELMGGRYKSGCWQASVVVVKAKGENPLRLARKRQRAY